ncbi:RagB/SusD family nutrient uptake outer membrane protein [Lewinella sp. IMCC34191]|uniref:RagB/SusD family nutrient uptake outer membrane protein n=1 Tax=Lewinella sp. IMCC34191 TaxID=2259172 RepID=UPI0018E58133|nr:RagB/SusD family nutrient uptake outer membrane protein [Lewinella sp. IMCC34191]
MSFRIYTSLSSVVAAACLLTFYACDPERVETPPLGVTEDSYFSTELEFERALFNAYAKMTDWYWFGGGSTATPNMAPVFHLMGDDITEASGPYGRWELFSGISPSDGRVAYMWEKTYELLQRSNLVIQKTEQAEPENFDDPSFLEVHRGEALFLRSLANFMLFNLYGTAPNINERLTSENTDQPRSQGVDLLDQIVTDLQTAAPLLPESWEARDLGRVNRPAAYGLLTKALVFRGNYTGNTADYSAAVEAFKNIEGRELTPNYTDNFNALTENNSESLFEFQASAAPKGDNPWLYNDGAWRGVESMSTFWGFYTVEPTAARNNLVGTPWRVTEKIFNAYGSDPRIAYFTEDDRSFTKYGKAGLEVLTQSGRPASQNNVRILRYADAMLLAAEGMVRSGGNLPEAIELVNRLRERASNWATSDTITDVTLPEAYDTAESDPAVVLEWIRAERIIELCGEKEKRWFDLKRYDAAGDLSLQNWDGSDAYFSSDLSAEFQFEYPKNLVLPIPQAEIDRNSAISENNPGY